MHSGQPARGGERGGGADRRSITSGWAPGSLPPGPRARRRSARRSAGRRRREDAPARRIRVVAVIPARRARGVDPLVGPSMRRAPPGCRGTPRRARPASGNRAAPQLVVPSRGPTIHIAGSGGPRRTRRRRATASASEVAPLSDTFSRTGRGRTGSRPARCACCVDQPGVTVRPASSITRVPAPIHRATSASSPTATTRPPGSRSRSRVARVVHRDHVAAAEHEVGGSADVRDGVPAARTEGRALAAEFHAPTIPSVVSSGHEPRRSRDRALTSGLSRAARLPQVTRTVRIKQGSAYGDDHIVAWSKDKGDGGGCCRSS